VEENRENLTLLLNAAGAGDSAAASALLPMVYDELRILAHQRLAKEAGGGRAITMQATGLVHEAYLRLVKDTEAQWNGRNHFFAAAAIAMRRILVERARAYAGPKRGGGKGKVSLDDAGAAVASPDEGPAGGGAGGMDWIALDEALSALEAHDPRLAQIVMLRYFAGLTVEKTAEVVGLSSRQVKREWNLARAWLYEKMTGEKPPERDA
jgi:RNA polymerase sigma factor (TIGR02999 family)